MGSMGCFSKGVSTTEFVHMNFNQDQGKNNTLFHYPWMDNKTSFLLYNIPSNTSTRSSKKECMRSMLFLQRAQGIFWPSRDDFFVNTMPIGRRNAVVELAEFNSISESLLL
jgi:hypothetical protein